MAFAIHCNLKHSDVAPVVLCSFWPNLYCLCA